jgi:hypothetical protein
LIDCGRCVTQTGYKQNPTFWLNHLRCTDRHRTGDNVRGIVLARWGGLGAHRYQVRRRTRAVVAHRTVPPPATTVACAGGLQRRCRAADVDEPRVPAVLQRHRSEVCRAAAAPVCGDCLSVCMLAHTRVCVYVCVRAASRMASGHTTSRAPPTTWRCTRDGSRSAPSPASCARTIEVRRLHPRSAHGRPALMSS